jgi:hypothetical protein
MNAGAFRRTHASKNTTTSIIRPLGRFNRAGNDSKSEFRNEFHFDHEKVAKIKFEWGGCQNTALDAPGLRRMGIDEN